MKVDIIVGGFQKCGTTALHEFLSAHNRVRCSYPKELDFFNYDERFSKGIRFYHSHFGKKAFLYSLLGYKFIESSPSYLNDGDINLTSRRIYEYNRNVKIICLVRNPVNRAFSAWQMYRKRYIHGNPNWWFDWMDTRIGSKIDAVRRTEEQFKDFNCFIRAEIQAKNDNKIIECGVLNNGLYSKAIEVFQKQFRNNFIVVKNEELNENTNSELINISKFLNLSKFDWTQFDEKKIFKGYYEGFLDRESKALLEKYYSVDNEELFRLTSIKY